MPLIVKICGLSDPISLDAALTAGADMVGFVFFPRSPRHVRIEQARALGARVSSRAKKVALTVDADDAALASVIDALEPDMLQLHGDETPERVGDIRARFKLPVMRAISLAELRDFARVAAFSAVADHLLFDARPPAGSDRPGGNGEAFDWKLLRDLETPRPWLLAGGLTCDNVETALLETKAPGLDVSSGVERAPGVKDVDKIRLFVARARRATVP